MLLLTSLPTFAFKVASFTASAEPRFLPRFSTARRHLLSLRFLTESQTICVILSGGDITTVALKSDESANFTVSRISQDQT